MKTLLISVNNETEPYPVAPIGAAYLAKALRDNGHEAIILDLCFVKDPFSSIDSVIKQFHPDIIGISIRNIDNLTFNKSRFYLPYIRNLVDFLKDRLPAPIVVGGSGFSIFPEEVLRYLDLDLGVVGEGENAILRIADALETGNDIRAIPNLAYTKDGIFTLNSMQYADINQHPERALIDNRKYLERGGMGNIQSKRGCPFKCSYCTYPNIEGTRLRLKEPGAVVDELKGMVKDFGIDYAFFVDDIFNFPQEHSMAICEAMIRDNLKIDWTCFCTPLGMTTELAGLMKTAGCKGVEFGSDAGAETTLKGLGKPFTPEDIRAASEVCTSVDLPDAHYIIIGGPCEDPVTMERTLTLFDDINPTAVIAMTGIRIYPCTNLQRRAIEDNIIEEDRGLLEPVFYISPHIGMEDIFERLSRHSALKNNWIVPSLGIRCDTELLSVLRRMGKRGPLWDML